MKPDQYYTYELYDPITGMKYIGSRTRKGIKDPKKDEDYRGTMKQKDLKDLWKDISKRSVKRIIKTFTDPVEALEHEVKLQKNVDVVNNPNYFNKVITSTAFTTKNYIRTPAHDELLRELSRKRMTVDNIAKRYNVKIKTARSKRVDHGNVFISPTNTIHYVDLVKMFCDEHKLNYSKITQQLRFKKSGEDNGWTCRTSTKREFKKYRGNVVIGE